MTRPLASPPTRRPRNALRADRPAAGQAPGLLFCSEALLKLPSPKLAALTLQS